MESTHLVVDPKELHEMGVAKDNCPRNPKKERDTVHIDLEEDVCFAEVNSCDKNVGAIPKAPSRGKDVRSNRVSPSWPNHGNQFENDEESVIIRSQSKRRIVIYDDDEDSTSGQAITNSEFIPCKNEEFPGTFDESKVSDVFSETTYSNEVNVAHSVNSERIHDKTMSIAHIETSQNSSFEYDAINMKINMKMKEAPKSILTSTTIKSRSVQRSFNVEKSIDTDDTYNGSNKMVMKQSKIELEKENEKSEDYSKNYDLTRSWTCKRCTFTSNPQNVKCDMCG